MKCRFVLFSNLSLATVTQAFTCEVSACFENLRFDLFLRLLLKCASILTDAFKNAPFLLTVLSFVVLYGAFKKFAKTQPTVFTQN